MTTDDLLRLTLNDVLLPVFAWALVACCAFPLRRGRDRSVLLSALLMALAFTVTVPHVYVALDHATGSTSVAELVKMTLVVVAAWTMSRGITRAVGTSVVPSSVTGGVLVVVLVVQTVAFLLVDRSGGTTTAFSLVHGDQPAAMVYSMAHFVYFGATLGAAGVACLRSGYGSAPRAVRIGVRLLIVGCAVAVLTSLDLVVRDVGLVLEREEVWGPAQSAYPPLLLLSVVLLALGLGLPPLLVGASRRRLARELPGLTARLTRLRDRASGRSGSLRFPVDARMPGEEPTPLDQLHRLVVEVRDQMFLDPAFEPTPDELRALTRSERLVGRLELL